MKKTMIEFSFIAINNILRLVRVLAVSNEGLWWSSLLRSRLECGGCVLEVIENGGESKENMRYGGGSAYCLQC